MRKHKWTITFLLAATAASFFIGELLTPVLSFMVGCSLGVVAVLAGLECDGR